MQLHHFKWEAGDVFPAGLAAPDYSYLHQRGRDPSGGQGTRWPGFYFEPVSLDSVVLLTVQSVDAEGKPVGTYVETFRIGDRYQVVAAWVISDSDVQTSEGVKVIRCRQ
jgi:hypothetical protein